MLMKTHCLVSNREGLGTSPFITRPIYGSQSEHIEISNILKFGSGPILNEQTVYLNENCRYTARFLAKRPQRRRVRRNGCFRRLRVSNTCI